MRPLLLIAALAAAVHAPAALPLEGMWQVNGYGPLLRIEHSGGSQGVLNVIWVDGADMSVPEGTVIGTATASPVAGLYDCIVSRDPLRVKDTKDRKATFAIRMADDAGSFTMEAYDKNVRFNPLRLLPYWYRNPFIPVDERPGQLDGAVRAGAPKTFLEP